MTCRAANAAGRRILGGGGVGQGNTGAAGVGGPVSGVARTSPPRGHCITIRGMSMLQIILLIALIALIAFWFFMRKKGA